MNTAECRLGVNARTLVTDRILGHGMIAIYASNFRMRILTSRARIVAVLDILTMIVGKIAVRASILRTM
jgi:hypothetical protein